MIIYYFINGSAQTLVISYIGMTAQEVAVSPNVRVVLQSSTQNLDEVVVTALGISREKKALGYAVQDVKGDDLTKAANTSLAGALQGKVAGIQVSPSSGMPGASAKITIRGNRSFDGDNTPLYVVDGMPIASTADISTGNSTAGADYATRALDIDPNDIESINVLKGQAASALYGMRASNGVIVITTKSGKGAGRAGKPQVTISSNLSFDKYSTLPRFQTEYAQGNYNATSKAYLNDPTSSFSWGPKISELPNDPVYGGNTANAYTNNGANLKQGQYYVPQRANAGLDPWTTPQIYNNAKEFFDTGVTWSNSVNVAQGNDKGHYSFSLGNTTQTGIVPNTGMDRYNARLMAETKLHHNWTTGFTGNFIHTKLSKSTGANDGLVATIYGAPANYDLKGIPVHYEGDPYKQNTYRATSGFDAAYWSVENNKFTERTNRFFGNSYLDYTTRLNTTNHKLTVKYQLGVDSYTTNYEDLWGYGHANDKGNVRHRAITVMEMNSLLTAMYTWNVNEQLVFDALIGNEFIHRTYKNVNEYGTDFNFGGWNHIENATTYNVAETSRRKRTAGNFFNLGLAYDNMLYLNVTGRMDKVSTMPRGNRSYFYPSVSVGWIFTELDVLKNDVLTYGKIRGSFAEVGQAGQYYEDYYRKPTYSGGFYSGYPIQYPVDGITSFTKYTEVYDPNLKPQNTRSYEVGTDLTFFNGLFSVGYTYSRQNVKDQIFSVPLPTSTGAAYLTTNGGKLHTDAHEITLDINPINTRNFKWDLGFNFSKIDSYVDELADGVDNINLGGFVDPQIRLSEGDKFPVIYGSTFLRDDKGNIVVNDKGLPIKSANDVIGSVSPDFILGFNTTFEIFKFRIGATFDWKHGGQMYGGTIYTLDNYGVSQRAANFRNMDSFLFEKPAVKQSDGTVNDIRIKGELSATDNSEVTADAREYFATLSGISEAGIYGSGYLKLREIVVSYPVYKKRDLEVNVSAFARNIILWSELDGFDPESNQGNNNMSGGFERFSLPGTSSYGFGVNVKF